MWDASTRREAEVSTPAKCHKIIARWLGWVSTHPFIPGGISGDPKTTVFLDRTAYFGTDLGPFAGSMRLYTYALLTSI
jgi:hypothetical protein